MMRGVIGSWSPSTFHLLLFALGGGLVFIGEEFGLAAATEIGLGFIGMLMAAAGIDLFIKKLGVFRVDDWTPSKVVETYREVSDMLWGLLFVGVGLAVMAVLLRRWLLHEATDTIWADVLGSTMVIGITMGFAGLLLSINGLVHLLAGRTEVAGGVRGFSDLMDRLLGAMHLLAGLTVFGVAFMLLVPGALPAVMEQLSRLVAVP